MYQKKRMLFHELRLPSFHAGVLVYFSLFRYSSSMTLEHQATPIFSGSALLSYNAPPHPPPLLPRPPPLPPSPPLFPPPSPLPSLSSQQWPGGAGKLVASSRLSRSPVVAFGSGGQMHASGMLGARIWASSWRVLGVGVLSRPRIGVAHLQGEQSKNE